MFKVNNKKTIQKLAICSFGANKMRNSFAVVAIILTTVLFTSMFTIASSLLSSMEESTMRQVGGSSHGGFKGLTIEQYDKLKSHPSIKEITYTVALGFAENEKLSRCPTEIRYVNSEAGAKEHFSFPTTGRLPQNDGEIATNTIVLEHLGIPAKIGELVTLEYSLGDKKCSDTFTLVGFWQGDKLMSASQAWLNRGYVEKQLAGYTQTGSDDLIGKIFADVSFSNSFNIEYKLHKVITDSGFAQDEINFGVNWAYIGNTGSMDMGAMSGGIFAILMIIFCGYLIISNVFLISVAKDIHFYGMLKTIGTTAKQIKYLIRSQALLLCTVGVPLGLFAGYLVGAFLTPIVLSILNTNIIKISINPIVFIFSALFAICTVFISVVKPSKIAAKVSPIEALRSTDVRQNSKKISKKNSSIKLWRMALDNVFANKKKAILVTVSLSLGMIILNTAYSMANSFDMDKYLNYMISNDFVLGDVSNFNVYIDYENQDTLNPNFLKELSGQSGIEMASSIYFAETEIATDPRFFDLPQRAEQVLKGIEESWLEGIRQAAQAPMMSQHIYGIDENILNKLTVFDGEIDLEKLKTGKYVMTDTYDTEGKLNYYEVGDKVTASNVKGENIEYEVLAIVSLPFKYSAQHTHPITSTIFLYSDVFLKDIAEKSPMLTVLNVADSDETNMENFLANYCKNVDDNMQYQSKATFVAEYENTRRTYKSVGTILSLLVAFIGIMNFTNTVVTSIIARKRELAMLQSIGMTNRQTQTMLIFEGLTYTILTAIFTLTIGSLLGNLGANALTGGSFFTLNFTVLPSLLALPILAAISILMPYISGKIMNKRSMIERLRAIE